MWWCMCGQVQSFSFCLLWLSLAGMHQVQTTKPSNVDVSKDIGFLLVFSCFCLSVSPGTLSKPNQEITLPKNNPIHSHHKTWKGDNQAFLGWTHIYGVLWCCLPWTLEVCRDRLATTCMCGVWWLSWLPIGTYCWHDITITVLTFLSHLCSLTYAGKPAFSFAACPHPEHPLHSWALFQQWPSCIWGHTLSINY